MPLLDLIRERIAAYGPLPLADYMALALSHPEHGYYMKKDPLGAGGDFTTAPEISQVFGELIGLWLAEQWRLLGQPEAALAELGPGRGTLMDDALRATRRIPGFHEAVSVHLVETSPALKAKQWQALAGRHPRIEWHAEFAGLPQKPVLLIANEFFDALPIRQFAHTEEGWRERMVGLDEEGNLVFLLSPPACGGIKGGDYPQAGTLPIDTPTPATSAGQALPSPASGGGRIDLKIFEHCQPALHIVRQLSRHILHHGGAALIVDYGYAHGSAGDTLQAMRAHAPCDPLHDPGEADLTAHVDFLALKEAAIRVGASSYGPVTQGAFLSRLGASLRAARLCENAAPEQKSAMLSGVERLLSREQMGALFKALCIVRPGHPMPEGF